MRSPRQGHAATAEVSRGEASRPSLTWGGSPRRARFAAALPGLVGWVAFAAGLTCTLGFLLRHTGFMMAYWVADGLFGLVGVPLAPLPGNAVLFFFLSLLAFMRKRLAVWLAVFALVMYLVTLLIVNVILIGGVVEAAPSWWVKAISTFVTVMTTVDVVVLARYRGAFLGRVQPAALGRVATILVVGTVLGISAALGLAKAYAPDFPRMRVVMWVLGRMAKPLEAFLPVVLDRPRHPLPIPLWVTSLLSLWMALVLIAAIVMFFYAQRLPSRTRSQDLQLRALLAQYGNQDSLSYFATRDNRFVVFSADGRAAVTYGVACGVAMAGGDPVGDHSAWDDAIRRWVRECYESGYLPAVISASDAGARAYRRVARMRVRLMGDEAVVRPQTFDARADSARALIRAARRVRRAGIEIEVRRQHEIAADELVELGAAAERFRNGEERGFSMALDRVFAPQDSDTLIVTARAADGELQCLLTFVPWGNHGLSLNLMRRSAGAVNGVVEAMVLRLIEVARDQRIEGISLNFAMFRKIFVEGAAVDAGFVKRLLYFAFRQASKVWQLESLYESNARYQPDWSARYMCLSSDPLFVVSAVAAGMLEGFLPAPRALVPTVAPQWRADAEYLAALAEQQRHIQQQATTRKLSEQQRVRRNKAAAARAAGIDPFPPGFDMGVTPAEVPAGGSVVVHGRISAIRRHGGVTFIDLSARGAKIQLLAERERMDPADYANLRLVDLGDTLVARGGVAPSRSGEKSVYLSDWRLAAKALRPVPAPGASLDAHTRTRARSLAFLVDDSSLRVIRQRSRALAAIRQSLSAQGYLEVETPMLQAVQGGANARPFVTHLNAYSADVFLRIAPELYLKRLAVAGMERIFEMGRSFRNEGADSTHNPEFTSLEAYCAGGDYTTMRELTQRLIQDAASACHGAPVIHRPAGSAGAGKGPIVARVEGQDMVAVDIGGQWPVIDVLTAISNATGTAVDSSTDAATLSELCRAHGINIPPGADEGGLIGALYDELVEATTLHPTFYTDFPVSSSPLTRKSRRDPKLAERWDLVAYGMELGTAYTELTDPVDQRERFTQQSLAAAAGDPEAMSLDEDFLNTLELGMPPTGGLGLGVDRLVMLITGCNIRQVLAFPFVKPEAHN